jgi:hypothetical protein
MVKRTFDLLDHCLKNRPREDAVAGNYGKGWVKFSTADFARKSELLAMALIGLGLKKGRPGSYCQR